MQDVVRECRQNTAPRQLQGADHITAAGDLTQENMLPVLRLLPVKAAKKGTRSCSFELGFVISKLADTIELLLQNLEDLPTALEAAAAISELGCPSVHGAANTASLRCADSQAQTPRRCRQFGICSVAWTLCRTGSSGHSFKSSQSFLM